MNVWYKSEKEPIELLLGLSGAVQYLEHTPKDDLNYWVWVKTKTGNKQIVIPIEAVRLIQFKKPSNEVIEAIKRQLATDPPAKEVFISIQTEEPRSYAVKLWHWFLRLVGSRD